MDGTGLSEVEHSIATFLSSRMPSDRASALHAETPLLTTGAVDSISVVELMLYLDQLYAIELSDEDFDEKYFATIRTLASFVESKRASR